MGEVNLNTSAYNIADMRKVIQEFAQIEPQSLDNAACERCMETPSNSDNLALQAYDRTTFQRYNRG